MSEDIKCPICGNDYCGDKCWESKKDLAILANALRKQLIELQSDKVEIISQRDTWIGNTDALRKQLEVALAELDYLEPRIDEYVKASIIKTLEEINRIGGINE